MSVETNPLLLELEQTPFDRICGSHVVPGVREILSEARVSIEALCAGPLPPTYRDTVERLDEITERVKTRVGPVTHLLSVAETPELREAFNEVLPEITEFWTRITLNEALWTRLKVFADTDEAAQLTGIEKRHLETVLRDFKRAGAELPAEEQDRLSSIRLEISKLQLKFSENVLDATNGYSLLISDEARLEGVPEDDREEARLKAVAAGEQGWLLTLDYPSFEPVVKYAVDRSLRKEVFDAYMSRCRGGEFSNLENIRRLLQLRRELSNVLGYEDFSDFRLEDHMAKSGQAAFQFVEELSHRTRPFWERDFAELLAHSKTLGLEDLCPWDAAFVTEDLRRLRYDIDDELIRPYFPLERVMDGMFEVANRVFGLVVKRREIDTVWHPDVLYYDVMDSDDGTHMGSFYADWHPRREKRQGAWMNDLFTGGPTEDGFDPHVGVIAGNLTPPKGKTPSLLTHREVETIFHEFGHLLHHLTSRVPIAPMAGINVAWDFVELPSQIMENWTWEEEALPLFSGHYETGDPLPDELYQRMVRARQFMGGWRQMRQLAFGFLDLRLHRDDVLPEDVDIMTHIEDLLECYAPSREFAQAHSTASFTHIFSGGYASAYYSYLWSEVLEADAFVRFKEGGIFSRDVGRSFLNCILTRGDSDDPEVLFREFMGRDPDQKALLERNLGPLSQEVGQESMA